MAATKLLNFISILLRIGGENLYEDSIVTWFGVGIPILSLGSLFILAIMEALIGEITIDKLVGASELFGPYCQV